MGFKCVALEVQGFQFSFAAIVHKKSNSEVHEQQALPP